MDMDLQEQPEWLEQFPDTLRTGDNDLVVGVQRQRTGSALNNPLGGGLWRFLNASFAVHIPEIQMTSRLMT